MLLPPSCPACGALGRAPCETCAAALRRAPALPSPAGVDRCLALLAYEGVGRELVARLKYRNARSAMPYLAGAMAALAAGQAVDVVTWVPTTAARRRSRGFDQAQLLATAVARRLRLPCRPLLRRAPGPAQTGRPLVERRRGPTFGPRRRGPVPARVLLVDDVVTSGATLTAAARALRAAGAREVHALVAARTPARRMPAGGVHSGHVELGPRNAADRRRSVGRRG
ncbi:MAG TPA: phosphoribosyltransferase family protein [Acidimicrobiales bacterium]|nr:phosphoribosyltransferase family protein [Acidimicrobiales bacterium]